MDEFHFICLEFLFGVLCSEAWITSGCAVYLQSTLNDVDCTICNGDFGCSELPRALREQASGWFWRRSVLLLSGR